MTRSLAWIVLLGAITHAAASAADTVVITEFMSQPIGETEDAREWIELFNYGTDPVDLDGWTLSDENNDAITIPKVTIAPGDFVILVPGGTIGRDENDRKGIFELEWLGGKEDPRVIGLSGRFNLANGADQIVVRNKRRQPVWGVAYRGDGTPGRATFYADEKFGIKFFGNKANPGINRAGNDGKYNFLGYEGNDHSTDPFAYESDVSKLEASYGPLYQSVENGGQAKPGVGSPLKGHYPGVKQP